MTCRQSGQGMASCLLVRGRDEPARRRLSATQRERQAGLLGPQTAVKTAPWDPRTEGEDQHEYRVHPRLLGHRDAVGGDDQRSLHGRRDGVPSATPAREKGGTCRQQGGEHVLAYSCNRDYLWGLAGSRMARPKELTAAPRIGPHQPYSTCSGQPALHLRPQFEVTRAIMLTR